MQVGTRFLYESGEGDQRKARTAIVTKADVPGEYGPRVAFVLDLDGRPSAEIVSTLELDPGYRGLLKEG